MVCRFFAVAVTICCSSVFSAIAQPVPQWSGLYLGVNTGGSLGIGNGDAAALFTTPTALGRAGGSTVLFEDSLKHAAPGWEIGGQLGYNWQIASWVVGVEADWQWALQHDTTHVGCSTPDTAAMFFAFAGSAFGECLTDAKKITNLGTARARGGYLINQALWYATGGLAWGTVEDSYSFFGTCNPTIAACAGALTGPFLPTTASFSQTRVGWTLGAGVESKLWWDRWSVKLEYLFVDLGTSRDAFNIATNPAFSPVASSAAVTTSSHLTDHIVRVGLNYHL
jgi:outer membrane immunogenic protein